MDSNSNVYEVANELDEEDQLIDNNSEGVFRRFFNYLWENLGECALIIVSSIFVLISGIFFLLDSGSNCSIKWVYMFIITERLLHFYTFIYKKNLEDQHISGWDLLYSVVRPTKYIAYFLVLIWGLVLNSSPLEECQDVSWKVWKITLSYFLIVHFFIFIVQSILVFLISCGIRLLCPNLILRVVQDYPIRIGADDNELIALETSVFTDKSIKRSDGTIFLLDKEDINCSICIDDYKENDILIMFLCDNVHPHHFHKKCCDEWLKISKTCPLCRTDITFESQHP